MMKTPQFGSESVVQRAAVLVQSLSLGLLLMTLAPALRAQALPAAEAAPISTGFALPRAAGTLNYAVSGSGNLSWGYYAGQGTTAFATVSGDVGYLSNSKREPFSMVFSGGHSWSFSTGQPSYSYLNLALSQVFNLDRWNFVVSDSVSYLPATPSVGLSGVPGTGDLGVQVGTDTGQGVLSDYSDRVANTASGSIQRQITGKTTANAYGSYGIIRFFDTSSSEGLDSNSETGGGGITHQINARDTIGGNYSYSNYTYSASSNGLIEPGFVSQTVSLQVSHQFTRKFRMTASAGPQWTSVDAAGSTQSLSVYANATATYAARNSSATVSYTRGTNSGYGVLGGELSQGGGVVFNRTFARVWNGAASGSYTQTSSLPAAGTTPFSFDTSVAGVQISRALVRGLSAYASYTLEHQSGEGNATAAVDVFSGLEQVVSFGVTYSPNSIHFGRQ